MKHVLQVTGTEVRLALADFLQRRLGIEAAEAQAWVRSGAVYLDGSRERRPAVPVYPGQQVTAHAAPIARVEVAPLAATVVFRDAELAVLDKPAGLASMPLRQGGVSLQDQLVGLLGSQARLLHRLDRETSGLLLCAVSRQARPVLAQAVAEHRLRRSYLAIVEGELGEAELLLRSRLASSGGRIRGSQDPRARQAETLVRNLRSLAGRTLVEAQLRTGRTHQVRVQLSEAGLPIVGDSRYGGPAAPRLALHAHRLQLLSPGGRWLDLHSPMPADFGELLPPRAGARGDADR